MSFLGLLPAGSQTLSLAGFSDHSVLISTPRTSLANGPGPNMEKALVDIKAVDAPALHSEDGKTGIASAERFGQGIIIDTAGIIVTNKHIVGSAQRVFVILSNGKNVEGRVLHNSELDLSFIKIDPPFVLTAISLGDSSQAHVGNPVFAFANAGSKTQRERGGAIVQLFKEELTDNVEYLKMSLLLNPGDSGGPILNEQGALLGLIIGNQKSDTGKSYALASNRIQEEYRKIRYSFLN